MLSVVANQSKKARESGLFCAQRLVSEALLDLMAERESDGKLSADFRQLPENRILALAPSLFYSVPYRQCPRHSGAQTWVGMGVWRGLSTG